MRKKFLAGAAILALLMGTPHVSADDDIVIFGEEFEDGTPPQPAAKPEPVKKAPSPKVEEPAPPPEAVKPPTPPAEQPVAVPPEEDDRWGDTLVFYDPNNFPKTTEPKQLEPTQPPTPPTQLEPPTEVTRPFEPSTIEPTQPPTTARSTLRRTPAYAPAPQQTLKTLKKRFVKLAADDTYTYYLDKSSVQWRRMPYSSSEYIADVWVRMVEHRPKQLDADLANYGTDSLNAEIRLLAEKGYQYAPEDLEVLRSSNYVLEHYYLRPQTKQVQFLCELEVFGRPQNTINERAYDYKNWENLVPGSVESAVYEATIKIIGKSKASERGHMTFSDMLDEYLRISL